MTSSIEIQLEAARKNLLDLSMRNRLLNFRPNKARSIRVIDEVPREIYDILVLNEKTMGFLPTPEATTDKFPEEDGETLFKEPSENGAASSQDEVSTLWKLPPPPEQLANKHVDRFLQTTLEPEPLQKRLFYINQQARSVFEEQGYTVLFLAIGFLEWKESGESIELRRAPLVLVPVELERASVHRSFRARWTGEDIYSNISLQQKLLEIGISIPEFLTPDEKDGIDRYFQDVVGCISKMPEWRIVSDVYLDFFSFTKFVMYKDLDLKSWPENKSPVDHPLIKGILEPSGGSESVIGFQMEQIDEKLRVEMSFI